MKTLGPKTNFRVVLTPRGLGDFGWFSISNVHGHGEDADARREQEYQERCEEMVRDAKRHVDNLQCAEVEFDQEPVCSYCGHNWTEKSPTYNGGCCDKDEDNNPNPEDEPE